MDVVDSWQALGCNGLCPIDFSSDEIKQHREELAEYNYVRSEINCRWMSEAELVGLGYYRR